MATASSSLVYIDVPFLGVDWKKMSLGQATAEPSTTPRGAYSCPRLFIGVLVAF